MPTTTNHITSSAGRWRHSMTDLAVFPDAELVTRAVLLAEPGLVEGLTVGTEVPADPAGSMSWLPFVRVTCIGGADDRITDTSRVTVTAFAVTKVAAAQLAELVRQRLTTRPVRTDAGVLDRAVTDSKPQQIPYSDNPPPFAYTASYAVTARRSTTN